MKTINKVIVTLYDDGDLKVTLNYLSDGSGDEVRAYFWDTDGKYIDYWSFEVEENIDAAIEAFSLYAEDNFADFFETAFGKEVIYNADADQWHEAVSKYGEDFVNHVDDMVIITKE